MTARRACSRASGYSFSSSPGWPTEMPPEPGFLRKLNLPPRPCLTSSTRVLGCSAFQSARWSPYSAGRPGTCPGSRRPSLAGCMNPQGYVWRSNITNEFWCRNRACSNDSSLPSTFRLYTTAVGRAVTRKQQWVDRRRCRSAVRISRRRTTWSADRRGLGRSGRLDHRFVIRPANCQPLRSSVDRGPIGSAACRGAGQSVP